MDCGPTCLRMIFHYYGKDADMVKLRQLTQFNKEGVSLLGIAHAAEKMGFKANGIAITFEQLVNEVDRPAILHWQQNHFIVLYQVAKNKIFVADPAKGLITYTPHDFKAKWLSAVDEVTGEATGIALLLEPTPDFYEENTGQKISTKRSWSFLFNYVLQYKRFFVQLILALLLGLLLQLLFPFLTQSIVDVGIQTRDLGYITIILVAQLMLFSGRMLTEFIRSRILLHISIRINLSILSDFWIKLMRLPISYFDAQHTGDTLQRLGDHRRIESFLTGTALNTIFSTFNLVIFSFILLYYNSTIFMVFFAGSLLYFLWIKLFLKFRKKLDYERFDIAAKENTLTMQLVQGMQEIKLQTATQLRRWEWENAQTKLFKLSFRSLSLNQYQQAGALFINEGKNIIITFIVAGLVVKGELTLGTMLAVQYIIGQLNSPVEQLISFVQTAQDANISLDRLNEIHEMEEEEKPGQITALKAGDNPPSFNEGHIAFKNISFTYPGAGNEPVLRNINFLISEGKTTAIVGASGSGKTTLVKLLLKFYDTYTGQIIIEQNSDHGSQTINFKDISPEYWRKTCGSVMQDGFIFSDTIAGNIAVSDEQPDVQKLLYACKVANILSYIRSLPLGFNTKIGAEGNGISAGQKQRLLIARAVYKNPQYIFLDEATNALDANNEKSIVENMKSFLDHKTVIVVAHRLSTVKNADKIVVLDNGAIIEEGTHETLTALKGKYYELVKNQLELGN